MSGEQIACERAYIRADGQQTPVVAQWEIPTEDDRCWGCTFSIQFGGEEIVRRRIFGVDGVQALDLAMKMASFELLRLDPPVYWNDPDDDLGLPIMDASSEVVEARQARRRPSNG